MFGAEKKPYAGTFRVYAYAEAAAVLLAVPIIGPYGYILLNTLMLLIGLRTAHHLTWPLAFAAFLPTMLFQPMAFG
jgi:hypothetical protein